MYQLNNYPMQHAENVFVVSSIVPLLFSKPYCNAYTILLGKLFG
jgi:hypothetical protein